jgi:CHASE2 domain-containing sensor protein
MKDERIQTTHNRIAAIGFCIWYVSMWISLCYRGLILQQHPREWWDIFAIWVIGILFVFIAFANKGLFDHRFGRSLTIGIGVGIIVFLTLTFIAGEIHSVVDVVMYLIGFLFVIGSVIGIVYFLNRRWKRKEGIEEEE